MHRSQPKVNDMEGPQLTIFHFCCPLCGAEPGSQPLRSYLQGWVDSPPDRLRAFLGIFEGALQAICKGQSRWKTKKFVRAAERVFREIRSLPELLYSGADFTLSLSDSQTLTFSCTCPICEFPGGTRKRGKYFTTWSEACRVQTGNLLYETGLVLWGCLRGLPTWASGQVLNDLNGLRHVVVRAYRDAGMMACPQCGRPVTCLFGGSKEPQRAFCRHCADMSGGFWPGLRIDIGEELSISVNPVYPDPQAPARNSRDVLPPDILEKTQE